MSANETDIQFRDSYFHNRTTLAKQARNSYITIPHLKVLRSTWSKKVKRYQNNEINGGFGNVSFENRFVQTSPAKSKQTLHANQQINTIKADMNSDKKYSHNQQNLLKRQKSLKSNISSHFIANRNMYNRNLHQDLSQSGILFEKFENQPHSMLRLDIKSKDSRQFLKSIKLKNNFNLFKGNFSKFTKKDIIHSIKTNRFNMSSEVQTSRYQKDRARMFV